MKKLIILVILLVSLLAVSAVSAADNATSDIDNNLIQSSDDSIDEVIASDEINNQDTLAISNENDTLKASFNDLQNIIDDASEGSEIELNDDYSLISGGDAIRISKSITINGNNHVLDGSNNHNIITIDADGKSIVFKNVKFEKGKYVEKGAAIYNAHSSTSLTLINCEFKENSASYLGGAVYSEGNMNIINSIFDSNHADADGGAVYCNGDLNITSSEFKGNIAKGNLIERCFGGAVRVNGKCDINSCTFRENKADHKGGAIYCKGDITVRFSEFTKNTANSNSFTYCNGGAIYCEGKSNIHSSIFQENDAGNKGGAICSEDTLNVTGNCNFSSNKCYAGTIACFKNIYGEFITFTNNFGEKGSAAYSENEVHIKNSVFKENQGNTGSSDYSGTGIYSDEDCHIDSCTFIDNKAKQGCGIYSCGNVFINNSDFSNNTASTDAGAIYCTKNVFVSNCRFDHNKALKAFEACFASTINAIKSITIDSSYFTNNSAEKGLSGVLFSYDKIIVTNSIFEDNHGDYAGVINCKDGVVTIENCSLNRNYANSHGAVYTYNVKKVSNSTFTKNKATDGDGGAIYVNNKCTFEISESIFEENTANDMGGAIYIDSSSTVMILSNCSFTNNHAKSKGGAVYDCGEIIIKDCNFTDNTAEEGGVVYTSTIKTVYNTTFTKNKAASSFGGVFYISNPCDLEFDTCRFEENTAGRKGGVVYTVYTRSTIKISNCSFVNNYAKDEGGALYINGEIIFIKDSEFTGNNAKKSGAIYASAINEQVSNSIFIKNQATTDDGGAIYINNACDPEFITCRFEENTAYYRGGAIYTDSRNTHLKLSYSTFVDNKAGGTGQSIYNSGYYDLLDMCWFGTNNPDFNDQFKIWHLSESDTDYIVSNYLKIGMKVNDTKISSDETYKATVYFYAINGNNLTNDLLHSTGAFYGDGHFSNVQADLNDMTADVVFTKEKSTIYGKLDNQVVSLTVDVEIKHGSEVNITSCENVTYPNALVVNFEITNRTTATYVIKNDKGEIITQGNITDANTLSVNNLLQGLYTITITNAENETTLSSNASANFNVTRMASVNVTADNVTYGNPTTITIKADCDGLYTVTTENGEIEINVTNGIGTKQIHYNPGNYHTTTKSNDEFVKLTELNEASFSVYKNNINLALDISNEFIYPNNITGTITTNVTGKYKLRINETEYILDIDSNSYEFNIGIYDAGKYKITVESMIEDYNKTTAEANITIAKGTPVVLLFVPNYNTTEEIEIFAYGSVDGNYTVKVGNINKTMIIKNNAGIVNMETTLPDGTYTATIEFEGDKNYNPISNSTNFTVSKVPSMFSISADNPVSSYGTPIVITHTLAPDATGHITYYIFDEKYAYLPVSKNLTIENLDAGTYLIEAVYSGDGHYNSTGDVIQIQINKAANTANVTVENVTYGTLSNITIKADADGNYTVDINGIKVTVNVKDGIGSELVKLNAGSYSTHTTFDSNNYNTTVTEADFEVTKAINNATVTVENTTYGNPSIINITANIDGIYTVNISGRIVTVNVKDGKGSNQIKLEKGTYTTSTTFADDNYELNVSEAKFEVTNLNNVKVTVENTTYGNSSIIHITADEDGIYTVKINETLSYNVTVIDGTGTQSINLNAGIYSTNTTFADDRYQTIVTEAEFEVYKADNNITIFTYGGTYEAQYIIFIMADFDGNYTVKVDSTIILVNISSGVGICDAGILEIGQHNVTVNFTGNNNIKSSNASASFTIYKAEPIVLVEADNVTYGEKAEIAVYSTLDGNYTLTIGNKTINITVENGFKLYDAGILNAGEYLITVTYPGDPHHENATGSTILNVNKMQTEIIPNNLTIELTFEDTSKINYTTIPDGLTDITFESSNSSIVSVDNEGVIIAKGAGTAEITLNFAGNENYNASNATVRITVNKANSTLKFESPVWDYGTSVNVTVNTTGATGITAKIGDENLKVDGFVIIMPDDLDAGPYAMIVTTIPDKNHNAANRTGLIWVNHVNSTLDVSDVNIEYGTAVNVTVNTTGATGITAKIDAKDIKVDGFTIEIPAMDVGTYTLTVTTVPDENHNAVTKNATVTIRKTDSTLTVSDIVFDYKDSGSATVSFTGATGVIAEVINQTKAIVNVDGTKITVSNLDAGTYTLSVTTIPDESHSPVTKTAKITVNKLKTTLTAKAITTTYNVNKNLVITLKDAKGNTISGAKVTVKIKTSKTYTTDKNGQIKVSTKGLAAKKYTAKITFKGDSNYVKSTKNVKVTVKKAKPKIVAKKKKFKVTTKTKKYTVKLKDNKGKAIKKAKLTLKVKGKTYKAKTNKKGKATFKITKLSKVGKFKATIKYKGNKNYKAVSKKVKLTVYFKTVSEGSKDKSTVQKIQRALKNNGYYLSYKGRYLMVDGKFQSCTERSVKEFQRDHGLKVTGKVDQKTAKKLKII